MPRQYGKVASNINTRGRSVSNTMRYQELLYPRALDNLSASSAAAYGFRKLKSSYNGPLIQVRRTSDNTTQDIGFDAYGNLNTSSLSTFAGASAGAYISKWYDQSGNAKHIIQGTNTVQPKIMTSGTLITQGNQPSMLFDGSSTNLPLDLSLATNVSGFSFSALANPTANSANSFLLYISTNSNAGLSRIAVFKSTTNNLVSGGRRLDADSNTTITSSSTVGGALIYNTNTIDYTNRIFKQYINGTLTGSNSTFQTSGSTTNANAQVAAIGNQNGASFYAGYVSEVIFFQAALSDTDRQSLEANQKSYYGL